MKNLFLKPSLFVILFFSAFFSQTLFAKSHSTFTNPPIFSEEPADVTFCVTLNAVIMEFTMCWDATPAPKDIKSAERNTVPLAFDKGYSMNIFLETNPYVEISTFASNLEGVIINSQKTLVSGIGYLKPGTYVITNGKLKIPFESLIRSTNTRQ